MSGEQPPRTADAKPFVFVSYTEADLAWATWIASALEDAGLTVRIQVWDSPPGSNFVGWMSSQMAGARWTVAVYSAAYFRSQWCTQEWTSALAKQTLLPIRIAPVAPPPPLDAVTWIDLFGLDEAAARLQLLNALQVEVLPRVAVGGFPGGAVFPGPGPAYEEQPAIVRPFDVEGLLSAAAEKLQERPGSQSTRLAAVYALERLAATTTDPAATALVAHALASHVLGSTIVPAERAAVILAIGRLPVHQPVDLSYIDLKHANLSGIRLPGVRLAGAKLEGAHLGAADLSDADLRGANLVNANLAGADLTRSWLAKADLRGARLVRVNLVETDFTGADLTGTDLTGATIDHVILDEARINDRTRWPSSQWESLVNSYAPYGTGSSYKIVEDKTPFAILSAGDALAASAGRNEDSVDQSEEESGIKKKRRKFFTKRSP
ncbi:pentapeptide repeat-containing protein [Pseudofrankia sp. BMG5.36]|uniref:pentapeptide repeat-containing protein n=1 Tax=Pseudofrankia sp. BMG5.36 TaxID=1834512 RepID=UPI0009F67E04|nr:pentapeptide repeat-containing protein [Pseudofrankia sp. BMG5.36]